MKKKIYFERPFFYHLPLILYHVSKGDKVIIFDIDGRLGKKKWFAKLIDKQIIFCHYVFHEKYNSLALDAVETVYKSWFGKSPMIKAMVDCYKDADVEMAYKKELARELSIFYGMQLLLSDESSKASSDCRIVLYPYKYNLFFKVLTKCNYLCYDIKNVMISSWMRVISKIHRVFANLAFYFLSISITVVLLCIALIKRVFTAEKHSLQSFRFAIAIKNPFFQFSFTEGRGFDFLLDHKRIRKDNSVFFAIASIPDSKIKTLNSEVYNIVNCANIFNILDFGFRNKSRYLIRTLARYSLRNIFASFLQQDSYIIVNIKLIVTFVLWNVILANFKLEHFISNNDEGVTHIGRNILLNKSGCTTWHYAHSGAFDYIFTNKKLNFYDLRMWLRSFMHYDNYVLWNNDTIRFMKMHPGKIKNYFNVGCVWSESISENKNRDAQAYLNRQGSSKSIPKDCRIVSVFDTTFFEGVNSKYRLKDGIKFYEDILRLLDEQENIFVIIKEKKPAGAYNSRRHLQYFELSEEFSKMLDEFNAHPRCYRAGHRGDPSEIIAVSDLTVSYAFGSPAIEALCARKKSIFYDPADRFRDYYYDKIPTLVSHNYEELKLKINNLLAITMDDYNKYLDEHILHKVEDYLDGKAITRFRDLLTVDGQKSNFTIQNEIERNIKRE